MKVVVALLACAMSVGALAGCAGSGAPSVSGFTPYYGPGSPPREKLPPEPEKADTAER